MLHVGEYCDFVRGVLSFVLLPFFHVDSGENTLRCPGCQTELSPSNVSIGA